MEYQALETTAEPVLLEPGDRLDGLTFTFDSEPIAAKPPPHKMGFNPPATPPAPKPISIPAFETVWIVNPTNGHAYKRIPCESREDAVAQATEEKAHLVTINDAAEQAWLTAVFGHEFYWIGLSDREKRGSGSGITTNRSLTKIGYPTISFLNPLMLMKEITLSRPSQMGNGMPLVLIVYSCV